MPGPSFVRLNYIFGTYILLTLKQPAEIKYATSGHKSCRVSLLMAVIAKVVPPPSAWVWKDRRKKGGIDNEAHVPSPKYFVPPSLRYPSGGNPLSEPVLKRAHPPLKLETPRSLANNSSFKCSLIEEIQSLLEQIYGA